PQYQNYVARSQLKGDYVQGQAAADAVAEYYYQNQKVPEDLSVIRNDPMLANDMGFMTVDSDNAVVTVTMASGAAADLSFYLVPSLDDDGAIHWQCSSDEIIPAMLPVACQ